MERQSGTKKDSSKVDKTRLLVLCPKGNLDSGGVISNFQLIQYLVKMGYKVKVITSWEGSYNETLTKIGIDNRTIPYNWWAPRDTPKDISVRSINAIAEIAGEIQAFQADVVITNTSHIPWGALAASMTNTPHIWTVREYPIKNFEYLADRVEFIKKYSNIIMTNSKELSAYYRDNYDCITGQFLSYVDTKGLTLGYEGDEVRLVSPNYMSIGKNQIELVKAAGILRARRKDLKFKILLMGEKEKTYGPKLEAAVNENNVADITEIYDRVSQPWDMVGKHDILVQTSLSESIGRTTTEAMKLGVPVIASDIPGHREAFDLGGGTLYKLGDPNDLAHKIEYVLDHPEETQQNARNAQKKALVTMSSEASNGPFARAIESIKGQNHPVGVNKQIWPYIGYYIREVNRKELTYLRDLERKNKDTDTLMNALEEIRNSQSYKIGRIPAVIAGKIKERLKGRK